MKKVTFILTTCIFLLLGTTFAWGDNTITWMVNGSVFATTTTSNGLVGALPKTDPASFNANYPYFTGWFTEAAAMDGAPDEAAPATQVTTTTEVTGNPTYYAVFSNAIDDIALQKKSSVNNGDVVYLATSDNAEGQGVTGAGLYVSTYQAFLKKKPHTDWIPFVVNGTADNFTLANAAKGGITITSASFTLGQEPYSPLRFHEDGYFISNDNNLVFMTRVSAIGYPMSYVGSTNYQLFYMYERTTPGYVSSSCSDGVTVSIVAQETSINLGVNGTAATSVACTKQGGIGNGTWSYEVSPATGTFDGTTFTATAAGTYTLTATYKESCSNIGKTKVVVTAIPTVYFTETPADPITFPTVECGESTALSDKKAVYVQGYNLTDNVTVTASAGYKVARTADATLADYTSSVTLSVTNGKINADNATVYILACPPKNSTAPTTGTLTITAAGGNAITANLSTPDITCSGYVLTLNNNGAETKAGIYCEGALVDKPADATISADCPYTFDGWSATPVTNGSSTYSKIDFTTYTMPKGNTTLYAVYSQTEGSKIYGKETVLAKNFTASIATEAKYDAVYATWTWKRNGSASYIYAGDYKYIFLAQKMIMEIAIKDEYAISSIYASMTPNGYEKYLSDGGLTGATMTADGKNHIIIPQGNTITINQSYMCYVDSFVVNYSTGEMTTTYYSDLACGYMQKEVTADETMTDLVNQNMDVVVKNGATLTITGKSQLHNVTVESGAALSVENNAALTLSSLYLAGGWATIDGKETYDMPRVYVENGSTFTIDQDSLYLDITLDKQNYYPFAVPFATKVSDIHYADATLAQAATYGTHFAIKTYDGVARAANAVDNTWATLGAEETLAPGKGYILTAVPGEGQTHAVIRIPMPYTNGSTPQSAITVTAYNNDGKAANHNIGWNFIANPYMTAFQGAQLTGIADLRYAQVPLYDFSDYSAVLLSETTLRPEWGFFVQAPESGTLNFAEAGQQRASMLLAEEESTTYVTLYLTNATLTTSDRLGIVINNRYTSHYEIGADLERMFGNAYTLATYTIMENTPLAYNALPAADAAKSIPVGFRAPQAGEYTFAIDPDQDTVGIKQIELQDLQEGITTNLLFNDYTFSVADRIQDDTRFVLRIVLHSQVISGMENITDTPTSGTYKTISNGHLYIVRDGKIYNATGKVM